MDKSKIGNNGYYALITGGSSGIGKAMAIELALRKHRLILIALPGKELEEAANHIHDKYGVDVHHLGIDLTQDNAQDEVYNWCKKEDLTVNILINNAGLGHAGSFTDSSNGMYDHMMRLNMIIMVGLTQKFIPMLKTTGNAHILNISSMAGLYPVPFKAIYSATKSFVHTFTRALREELVDQHIQVSCLYPGPTDTNPEVKARIEAAGGPAKMALMTAEKVAQITIHKMFEGKIMIIPGIPNKAFRLFAKIVPQGIMQKLFVRTFNRS